MPWTCYWLDPTGEAEVALRRYSTQSDSESVRLGFTCESGYHAALGWLGQRVPYDRDVSGIWPAAGKVFDVPGHDDPRWPVECAKGCGYRFTDDDRWQPWAEALFARADNGALEVLHPDVSPPGIPSAGPGAMWDAAWLKGFGLSPDWPGDVILTVRCPYMTGEPGGWDWHPDRPASSGGYWTRNGDPRNPPSLTVTPSIAIGPNTDPRHYHGFLTAGVLTDHVG